MRIDRTHRPWLAAFLVASVVGVGLLALARRGGSTRLGGTTAGLALGVLAALFIVGSALLGARRRLLRLPLGALSTWLRAHLWIGLASLVFALLHGGLALGGPLTTALVVTLVTCVASGVFGAFLQHVLPAEVGPTFPSDARPETTRERSLQRWMHGWLLVHVPLSMALLVLLAAHAVLSLRY